MPLKPFKASATATVESTLQRMSSNEANGGLRSLCWSLFDNVILLQMGTTYRRRFEDFAHMEDDKSSIEQWRKDQQDEWNRLSMTVRTDISD